MSNLRIARILYQHGVHFYEQDGHIYADTMAAGAELFEEVEDLTGYSRNKLFAWLGY